jgi:hypothetical protein
LLLGQIHTGIFPRRASQPALLARLGSVTGFEGRLLSLG